LARKLELSYSPHTSLAKIAARKLEYIRSRQRLAADAARTQEKEQTVAWHMETFERFCALLEVVDKHGVRRRLVPSPRQLQYIAEMSPRDIILKPRQVWMTTLILALMVYRFLTFRGARVMIVCQSMTGNAPVSGISTTIRRYFESLQSAGLRLNFSTEKATEWAIDELDASLRIVVAGASELSAAKVGRSGTITHLMCTEQAFWEFADETLNALLECVPGPEHGSQIITESTANGAAGLFFQQCKKAQAKEGSYKFHFIPWFAHPEYSLPLDDGEVVEPKTDRERALVALGVTPQNLKWYRLKVADKGQDKTDQEYPSDPESCFLLSGRGFFDRATTALLAMQAKPPIELRERDRIAIYKGPEPGHTYIVSADTSSGEGQDENDLDSSAAIIRDKATGELCAALHGMYLPVDLADALAKLGNEYNRALIVVERENHGHAVHLQLNTHLKYGNLYRHEDGKLGWPENQVTRPAMLDLLEDAHRKGLWKSHHRATLGQFRTFIINSAGRPEAAKGEHDDLVMAEAIGWAVRAKPTRTYDGIGRAKSAWT
jgi:hypothetical protein